MYYTYINTFLAVCRHKSFTAAAAELYVSQPAISRHVNILEDYYGCRLIDRDNKKVVLTPAGEVLKEHAETIMNMINIIDDDIADLLNQVRGKLIIGASFTVAEYFLPKYLRYFSETYQDVTIIMNVDNTESILQQIKNEEVDIGLVEGEINDPNIPHQVFYEDEMVVVVPNNHELCNSDNLTIEEFVQYPIILREKGSGTRRILENKVKELGLLLTPSVVMELGSTQAIKEAIKNNIGISVLSGLTVKEEVLNNILCALYFEKFRLKRTFKLALKNNKTQNIKIKTFINNLYDYVEN